MAFPFDSVRLSFTEIFRTHEFHGQHGNDQFGSIALTVLF